MTKGLGIHLAIPNTNSLVLGGVDSSLSPNLLYFIMTQFFFQYFAKNCFMMKR